jgi:stage II sporulation protein AA (anti-sigma F factor antagonist)
VSAAELRRPIARFAIDEETLTDGTRVVTVKGELDLATAPGLGQRIRRPMFWERVDRVLVDLSGVAFLDSSGASALLLSRSHAKALGRRIGFVCPDGRALRRLEIYGLVEMLPVHPTREEALASFLGP